MPRRTQPGGRTAPRALTTTITTLTTSALALTLVTVGPTGISSATPDQPRATTAATTAPAKAAQPTGHARIHPVLASFFPNQPGTITGLLGSRKVRPVMLQRPVNGRWETFRTVRTAQDGTFTFSDLSFSSNQTLRVEAKPVEFIGNTTLSEAEKAEKQAKRELAKAQTALDKAKNKLKKAKRSLQRARDLGLKRRVIKARKKAVTRAQNRVDDLIAGRNADRKDYLRARGKANMKPYVAPWSISPAIVVPVESQRITIGAIPPIAQPGTTPQAAPKEDGVLVNVRVVPARQGRKVTLHSNDGTGWREAGTQLTDRTGNVLFTSSPGLRVHATVTASHGGTDGISPEVRTKVFPLDFEEQFNGSALDQTKWSFQNRPIGNGLRGCAITDGSSSTVSGGLLKMGVSKDPRRAGETCWHTTPKGVKHALPYMRNTQIDSQDKYSFQYGFAAARMRAQSADGMHSAFWSHPNQALVPGRVDLGVEIDVMEYFGDEFHEKGIGTYTHSARANGEVVKSGQVFGVTQELLLPNSTSYSQQFSVFSMEWTPTEYVFRIDGREYHRKSTDLSRSPQFLALSNLTSNWELMDLEDFGSTADVDWVRVFRP